MTKTLDVATIRACIAGEADAISSVLSFYDAYITRHSYVPGFDKYGISRRYLDSDIKAKIQAEVIRAIQKFDLEGCLKNGP